MINEMDTLSKLILSPGNLYNTSIFKDKPLNGLKAYQDNYLHSLIDSLKGKFEVTEKILGRKNFSFFCRSFVYESPSHSQNLDDYGEGLPNFLSQKKELEEIGYIKYLAKLDWFWFHSEQNLNKELLLPKGILGLWGKIKNSQDIGEIVLEESNEAIRFQEDGQSLFSHSFLDRQI